MIYGLGPAHRVVIDLSTGGTMAYRAVIENAKNLDKAFGAKSVEIEIVCRGAGIDMLFKGGPVSSQVKSLEAYDVKLAACGNTVRARHVSRRELIDGVSIVDAGVAEVVRRQEQGWAYIKGGL